MADSPFSISRRDLYAALGNDRVARVVERLIQLAQAQLADQILLAVADPTGYPNGRVLTPGTGIVLDDSVDGELTISVEDDPLEVNKLHVLDDIAVDDDIEAQGDIRAHGEIRGDTLRLDQPAVPSTAIADLSLPVTIDGVTVHLLLSSTP